MAAKKAPARKTPAKRSTKRSTARPTSKSLKTTAHRHAAGSTPTGCAYSVTWKRLASTRGYVQVWVKKQAYDEVVKHLLDHGTPASNRKLRMRAQPLGVETTCGGTCEGGWCKQLPIECDATGCSFHCTCTYFV